MVDLSAFRHGAGEAAAEGRRTAAQELSAAFSDTGFAIVVGTGVAARLVSELREHAYGFFQQGQAEKAKVNEGSGEGYGLSPYCSMEENGAQLLGDFTKPNDIVESLTFRRLQPEAVQGTLQRPAGLAEAVLAFNEELAALRRTLEAAGEIAFGLEEGALAEKCRGADESLRLAYYPELSRPPLEGQLRYGAHVDSFGVTVLSLDPSRPEGLQVQVDGGWVDVPFLQGSFVLNVGAMLSRWTNGLWKASVHRVALRPGRRLSIVSGALRPRDDVVLEALGPEAPRQPPVLAGDFVAERVAMHRPSYLAEKGVAPDGAEGLGDHIRSYTV